MHKIANTIMDGIELLHARIMSSLRAKEDGSHRNLLEQVFSFDAFFDEDSGAVELVELDVFGARSGLDACLFEWTKSLKFSSPRYRMRSSFVLCFNDQGRKSREAGGRELRLGMADAAVYA